MTRSAPTSLGAYSYSRSSALWLSTPPHPGKLRRQVLAKGRRAEMRAYKRVTPRSSYEDRHTNRNLKMVRHQSLLSPARVSHPVLSHSLARLLLFLLVSIRPSMCAYTTGSETIAGRWQSGTPFIYQIHAVVSNAGAQCRLRFNLFLLPSLQSSLGGVSEPIGWLIHCLSLLVLA